MKPETLSYAGYCTDCDKVHSLPSDKAIPYAKELMGQLQEHKRIDFSVPIEEANPLLSTEVLYNRLGQMFGILVCEDDKGQEQILKAFSCTHHGLWIVDGWVPPLTDTPKYLELVAEGNRQIYPITDFIATLEKGGKEYQKAVKERKLVSHKIMDLLLELYKVHNFNGDCKLLTEAFYLKKNIPMGTGDCCAPKLLNEAAKRGWKPLSIAEFYWGKETEAASRKEGEFYSSCEGRCEPLLGFMLCGGSK